MSTLRDEFRDWLNDNLKGEYECLRWRGMPGDDEAYPELRKIWEAKLGEAGWIGLDWPSEYGGRGASDADIIELAEEYAEHGGPGRCGHIGETLLAPTLLAYGTKEQQDKYLPGIKNGTEFWCQGYSEPGAGSDLANVKTKARLENGEWIIDGQKIWTSLALESDYIFVVARAEPGSVGNKGLVFLLVKLDQPGVDIRPIKQMSGSSEFNEVYFTEAKCAEGDIVGKVGDGWRVAMALLAFERGTSTIGQQMTFKNELNAVIKLAKQNGAANDPLIRTRIAKAYTELQIMKFGFRRTLSSDQMSGADFTSKIFWSTWHRNLGELAADVMGASAEIINEGEFSALQKLFLYSRADTIYGGTNQIQRNIIAERALGMPREPRGGQMVTKG
ncbi:acyl-CoA dehydrogenase family protein [Fretibacter rubidus]|uniref:acyl-CoA dehydrogenase family protein n=1 Tax=Fretibacter rubidus TaxID=570162 RepID=UPI00352B8CD3